MDNYTNTYLCGYFLIIESKDKWKYVKTVMIKVLDEYSIVTLSDKILLLILDIKSISSTLKQRIRNKLLLYGVI